MARELDKCKQCYWMFYRGHEGMYCKGPQTKWHKWTGKETYISSDYADYYHLTCFHQRSFRDGERGPWKPKKDPCSYYVGIWG